ncbi:S-layer protein [uncultured archaeon]|nr:S-layer protein [uncultured archaeon]
MKYMKGKYEQRRCSQSLLLLFLPIIAFAILSGCVSQQHDVLKINPVIDYNPLEGFTGKSEGMFTVIKGSIPEVKESLKNIVIKKVAQTSTFSVDDDLNFVVYRGVFSTGGYGISIDRVEKQGNIFTVYATYRDPGKGIGVTEAFTQPTAIIPIGKLAEGDYEARLRVTWVLDTIEGRNVIEPEKELSVYNFEVKPTASNIGISRENVSSAYSADQVFDESAGNFTKKWDAKNFAGFWRDPETNISTETLVIDQSILNNSHRIIEKHNLIYTTKSMPVKYRVYMHANQTPPGTEGFYSAAGWLGEKHVYLQGGTGSRR